MAIRLLKGLAVPVGLALLFGIIGLAVRQSLLDDYMPVRDVPASGVFLLGAVPGLLLGVPTMFRIWRDG
ncbi:MAG: hypothetical protein ACF8PN_10395 [Phycisphaerales bacterium]